MLARRAVRMANEGRIVPTTDTDEVMLAAFEREWAEYLPRMHALVRVEITRAVDRFAPPPPYDLSHDKAERWAANRAKLAAR